LACKKFTTKGTKITKDFFVIFVPFVDKTKIYSSRMPVFVFQNGKFAAQFITGPSSIFLRLEFSEHRIDLPAITLLQSDFRYGNPDECSARESLIAGTDDANIECGTNFHPKSAEYIADNDRNGLLLRIAASAIVKRLAERGEAAFPS
jgi:hypothetical protein